MRNDHRALMALHHVVPRTGRALPGFRAWLPDAHPTSLPGILAERFAAQVGPVWQGADALPPGRRAYLEALVGRLASSDVVEEASRLHRHGTGVILHVVRWHRAKAGRSVAAALVIPPEDLVLRALDVSFGRDRVMPDALGAVSHWRAERRAGGPIDVPEVGAAVDAAVREASTFGPPVRSRRPSPEAPW